MPQRPQPSLRLADGGNFITRWAQNVMRPGNTDKRLREIEAPPPAPVARPAPPPPPPPPPPNATPDNPAGIRFQDGGMFGDLDQIQQSRRQRVLAEAAQDMTASQAEADREAMDMVQRGEARWVGFQDGGGLSKEAVMEAIARQRAAAGSQSGGGSDTAPQTQPQPQPQQPSMLRDFLRNPGSVLRDRERAAGLRFQDGGVVPGSGRGDKIPAKYEPGEFVVSNDMIDDNPGLREHLAGLRAETLAARGKTVEEADAKALRYHEGLRGGEYGQGTRNEELPAAHARGRDLQRSDGQGGDVLHSRGGDTEGARHAQVSLRADTGGAYDPFGRMAKDLTGQNSLPPKSPVGNMADDLARNARAAPPPPPPPPPGPANPGMANPQAQAAYDDMARARAQPAAPTVEPAAPKPPGATSKWFGSADDWKNFAKGPADSPHKTMRMTAPEAPGKLAKAGGVVQGLAGAYNAYQGVQEGDALKAGVGAADAIAAGALLTPAAPVAGTYLGLRGAWDMGKAAGGAINDYLLSDKVKDAIGGTFNQIGLNTGLWGEDDSTKLMADAQARAGQPADTPRKTAPTPTPDLRNPYAAATAAEKARIEAAQATEADRRARAAETDRRARATETDRRAQADSTAHPDLGYGPIGDRTTLTNEQVSIMNPQGRVTAVRQPNGTLALSGGDVRGEVSYQDASGKPLPGGGLRGKFADFQVAPAGSTVVAGPNGSYAFGSGGAGGSAGGGTAGMTPSQAAQYNAEVQRAQAINADERARHNTPAARMQRLADPFTAEGRAMRNLQMDIDSSLDRKGRPTGRTQALVDQYKAATGAYLEEPGQQRVAETERYKSDNSLRGNMYSSDNSLRGTVYSTDAQLGGKHMEMQQKMRQQQLVGEAWKAAKGDPKAFQDYMMQFGMTDAAKTGGDMARDNQTLAHLATNNARERLKGMAVRDDGKGGTVVDEGRLARLESTLAKMSPGWAQADEATQAKLLRKAEASVNILEGLNSQRNNGWFQTFGIDGKSAQLDNLPHKEMKGAKLNEVGFVEGAKTPGTSRKDYVIETSGGHKLYLPRSSVNQGELELLKSLGVDITGTEK